MTTLKITAGSKIQVNNVEGNTTKKGAKQNKVYTITFQYSNEELLPNGKICDISMFYKATDGKKDFEIWDIHKNMKTLGIRKSGSSRYSYTENFTLID